MENMDYMSVHQKGQTKKKWTEDGRILVEAQSELGARSKIYLRGRRQRQSKKLVQYSTTGNKRNQKVLRCKRLKAEERGSVCADIRLQQLRGPSKHL